MKKKIREKKHIERLNLNEEKKTEKMLKIKQLLFSLKEFKESEKIAFYAGIEGELETIEMIKESLKTGKKIFLPVTDFEKKEMHLSEILSMEDLQEKQISNGKKLLEPVNKKIAGEKEIELIVVPLVAFDRACHRIGYGKGFYDRFLKKIEKNVTTIGLAFSEQETKKIPTEEHDIALKKIITEKEIIEC